MTDLKNCWFCGSAPDAPVPFTGRVLIMCSCSEEPMVLEKNQEEAVEKWNRLADDHAAERRSRIKLIKLIELIEQIEAVEDFLTYIARVSSLSKQLCQMADDHAQALSTLSMSDVPAEEITFRDQEFGNGGK